MATLHTTMNPQSVYAAVEQTYAYRATNPVNSQLSQSIARALGYRVEDFVDVPQAANLGEGCGNPLAIANLRPGDVVLDVGCGGGFDVFQASKMVGPTGKVIGIDMTKDMIDLAKRNAKEMEISNVEFIHCKATEIPLAAESVDCVISNCVLNLVPESDKAVVLETLHRLLRPNGRLVMSDFLALKPMPDEMKNNEALIAGCVAGAVEVDQLQTMLNKIGFNDILLVNKNVDLNVYNNGDTTKSVTPCCSGKSCGTGARSTGSGRQVVAYDLNEWISSFDIYCHKPEDRSKGSAVVTASICGTKCGSGQANRKTCC